MRRVLALSLSLALPFLAGAAAPEPSFSSIQPELLGVVGSLSNAWADFDNDGDLDLFLANQSGKADQLFRNDGAAGFVDVAPKLGMQGPKRTVEEGGVGCAVGDYDGDGKLDIFVPNYGHNALWHNNGDGTFTNTAAQMGVGIENHAVGAAWGDYDNDGFPDLAVMSYEGVPDKQTPEDSLFHNEGGKGFKQVIDVKSQLNAGDHGVTWVDYNNDGAIDLSVTRGYSPVGNHYLFRNDLPAAQAKKSLSVLVLDAKGHYTQAGAEVRLYDAKGKLLGAGQVSTGGGYGAQNAAPVHFGVPNVELARYAGRSLIVKRAVAE